jgi:AcrR family transcriptional regulator
MIGPMPGQTTSRIPRTDGRTARAERTREAIADAVLSLLEEGHLRPTAHDVAGRAEVSLRSVFQHFADMETLLASVAERQTATVLSQALYVPDDGPLPERINALVAERARLHELITPVRRAGLLHEPFSPAIAERLRWIREQARREVSKVFALELERLPAAERRLLLETLSVATSWTTWEALRRHQGLSRPQAENAMRIMVESLLAASGTR